MVERHVEEQDEHEELAFEAPKRESAEEMLDAHAGDVLDPMRHSAAHVMAEAVMDLFPGTRLGIGPAIENGFYYDFEVSRPLTTDDLAAIQERMAASIAADHHFVRKVLPPDAGRAFFEQRGQPYKVEILDDLRRAAVEAGTPEPEVSTYEHGPFIDLCRGPHVESTGRIGPFKLLAVSGAYWRGDQARPALQRVYGTVWSTQEELDQYLWRREEAKKRDHRRLGVQLDLFSFHDVSPGVAFWHPKGWTLYQTLREALREMQARRGYQEIYTPPLVHQKLWQQSGHWDLYRDHMFIIEAEDQTYSLKPMNCPESTFVYRSRVRSYRELPLRLSEYGVLHRNELSGTLSGLTRVRHFVQDDAHIYVTPAQIQDEILALMSEVRESYSWFGLEPLLTFGTRPDKALGDEQTWRETEAQMLDALKASGVNYRVKPGDGAFYAPKIDIQVQDALGREWQTATIQVDRLMLPERFGLDVRRRARRARSGRWRSTGRSLARSSASSGLSRSTSRAPSRSGARPFRRSSSPSPTATSRRPASSPVELRGAACGSTSTTAANRMQNKIRLAQEQKVPYMLVLGDREVEARTAAPRTRAGEQQPPLGWAELADRLVGEAADKRPG